MDVAYLVAPFATWLVAGCAKFAINSLRAKRLAFGLIGYGGMPSNHSAMVTAMAVLIALREGIAHPAFGVAVTLAFIVMLDANSLRRQVGRHAEAINRLNAATGVAGELLRERMGHSRLEIAGGIVTGALVAWLIDMFV
ncbi:divergent PAP2 family protein [Pseudomonas mangiferae]|uniref:Divergent PAP2 family protein n=1 Tax=Pseudomonas mangiferae TaxID=2593654 RepID=A0A553GTN6_9PSED|nr:divergent PAP2 family protein [Pseudomonas mangiferae]TRX72864.1 divergent PAP2 family protein [Pseudomonas mangiferae]